MGEGGGNRAEIERVAAAVAGKVAGSMGELAVFVAETDAVLERLCDERAVLKHFEWPEARYDAMREACALQKEIQGLKGKLQAAQTQEEMAAVFSKVQLRVEALMRTAEADGKRLREHGVPWNASWHVAVKQDCLGLCARYLTAALQEATALKAMAAGSASASDGSSSLRRSGFGRAITPEKAASAAEGKLRDAVQLVFRVHQFVGGLDPACIDVFGAVQQLYSSLQRGSCDDGLGA